MKTPSLTTAASIAIHTARIQLPDHPSILTDRPMDPP